MDSYKYYKCWQISRIDIRPGCKGSHTTQHICIKINNLDIEKRTSQNMTQNK